MGGQWGKMVKEGLIQYIKGGVRPERSGGIEGRGEM